MSQHPEPNKQRIIDALDVMRRKDYAEKRVFQARAYDTAIKALKGIAGDITSLKDVEGIKGIGAKIQEKITEILETGSLAAAERTRASPTFGAYESLLGVYGIGPAKAKILVESGILTIEDLRAKVVADPDFLTAAQTIGLRHYEPLLERIPRTEMVEHEKTILGSLGPEFKAMIVGSYRRGAVDSGDIDVLLTLSDELTPFKRIQLFRKAVRAFQEQGYITDILALGSTKCMGISKLVGGKARRLDLLMIPAEQFPYAVLYFTGSDLFNIAFRGYALEKGYTMNEHEMKPTGAKPAPPRMESEKDIFTFLGLQYVEPHMRRGAADLLPIASL